MTDEEPIGRAKWTGVADQPLRRTMTAKRSQAGHEFVAQEGGNSDWHEVHRLDALEQFETDPDFEVEWFT